MKIEKVHPAGWKMETGSNTYYFGEYGKFGCYCNEGVVYKNEQAFENGDDVCYIPEYGFDNEEENANQLFEFHAKEAAASGVEYNSYIATSGYTREDLEALCDGMNFNARELFDHLDWQYPETLIDEWQRDEEENV